jgi:hypothetical protein
MPKINALRTTERCTCQVCGLQGEVARPQATVCAHCANDPERARALLAARIEGSTQRATAAWLHLNRAVDAVEAAGLADRWARLRQALEEVHILTADAATQARVRQALDAAQSADTTKLPAPLAQALLGYEAHYWAQDARKRARLQAEIAGVALEDCLALATAA